MSARLQALEADAMATYVPPGGSLVDTDSQKEGTSLGKPVSAGTASWISCGSPSGASVAYSPTGLPSGAIALMGEL